VVKEALTCGTPIVSVNVGDVKDVTKGIEGCYITNYDANDLADNLKKAIAFQGKTEGPLRIVERNLSNELVAKRIIDIYQKVIEQKG
jgi:glycosyltransferase involved in cell wall biosynthesis